MDASNFICRVCLQVCPVEYSVIKENIIGLIKLLTEVDVCADDSLPKVCCSKCTLDLNFVEKMRRLIIRSDERLRDVLNTDGDFRQLLGSANQLIIPVQDKDTTGNYAEPIVEIIEIKQELPVSDVQNQEFENNQDYSVELTKIELRENVDCKVDITIKDDFNKPMDMLKNIISKISVDLYHCNICNIDIHSSKESQAHKAKHIQKTCDICGVTTGSKNFSKHMKIHTLGQQICHVCGSIYKSFESLRTHIFHFHNEKKKLYTCEDCGAKFKYSGGLSYHKRRVHLGIRPYQCESCDKSFFDLETMKKHVRSVHLKLREHPCEYCKKQFSSRKILKVHKRQHTNETPYICDICSEGFRQRVSLKKHLIKHEKDGTMENMSTSKEDKEDTIDVKNEESLC